MIRSKNFDTIEAAHQPSSIMDNRSILLEELSATPDAIVSEVLSFLRYLKFKDSGVDIEDLIDSNELRHAMHNSEGFITPEELLAARPI
jgi:hypothetical protein